MHVLISALSRFTHPTGICRHAANLARCLAESHDVRQVTLVIGDWQRHYYAQTFRLPPDKIELVAVKLPNYALLRNGFFLTGLPKLAREAAPDIVHLAFPQPFLRPLLPCPVVSTIHDLYPFDIPENFGVRTVWFNRMFFLQCVASSTALICVSDCTQRRVRKLFPRLVGDKPVRTIHNYVDLAAITPEPPQLDSLPQTAYLLAVGQHRKNKNLLLLIRAYARLLESSAIPSETKLVIVGTPGPETPMLRSLIAAHRFEDRVLLPPELSEAQLCWIYQNCAAFIAPSSHEGFGLPLAEALYFRCRVVCSDIEIFREIGSEDCTYFSLDGRPVDQLAAAIVRALHHAPPNSAKSRLSKSSARAQYLALYSEALNCPGSLVIRPNQSVGDLAESKARLHT